MGDLKPMELLTCPFCGSEPRKDANEYFSTPPSRFRISCQNTDCHFNPTTGWHDGDESDKRWNRRSAPPVDLIEKKKLEQALEAAKWHLEAAKDSHDHWKGCPVCGDLAKINAALKSLAQPIPQTPKEGNV